MARYTEPTAEQEAGWKVWVAERPDNVRVNAERFNPWTLYRLKTTNQLVTLASFSENGTVSVNVTAEFNVLTFERRVFGVNPDDLEEADLPPHKGAVLLSPEEVDEHIDVLRALVRPDLFQLDKDGVAQRKH